MAFLQFSKVTRPKLKQENPTMSFGDLSKLVGQKWRTLSEVDKAPYVDAFQKEKRERLASDQTNKKSKKAKKKDKTEDKPKPVSAKGAMYDYYGGAAHSAPQDNAWLSAYSYPGAYNNNQPHDMIPDQRSMGYPASFTGTPSSSMPWPASAGHIPTGIPWPAESTHSSGFFAGHQGQHMPVPSGQHMPVPSGQHMPVPSGQHMTVPSGQHMLVPTGQHMPVPAGQPIPIPAGQPIPVPAGQPIPVPTGIFTSEFYQQQMASTTNSPANTDNPASKVEQSSDDQSGPVMNVVVI